MQFTNSIQALAFVAAVNAVQFTNTNFQIQAGQPFDITWSGNVAPVTIFLKDGEPGNLQTVNTVVSGATGNSFTWLPSASLPNAMYALAIEDDGETDVNYSPQFQYSGGVAALPSTTSTPVSVPVTSTSSSSATEPTSTSVALTTAPMTSTTLDSAPLTSTSASSVATVVPVSGNLTMTSFSTSSATGTKTGTTGIASKATATASKTNSSSEASHTANSAGSHLQNPTAFTFVVCAAVAFIY